MLFWVWLWEDHSFVTWRKPVWVPLWVSVGVPMSVTNDDRDNFPPSQDSLTPAMSVNMMLPTQTHYISQTTVEARGDTHPVSERYYWVYVVILLSPAFYLFSEFWLERNRTLQMIWFLAPTGAQEMPISPSSLRGEILVPKEQIPGALKSFR